MTGRIVSSGKDLLFIEDELPMPSASLPFVNLPNRCTIVRLKGRQLVVVSPTENFAEYTEQINDFGTVVAIVEPNMFHHLFTAAAKRIYPQAQLFGVDGHFQKCPHIPWEKVLNSGTWPWKDELPVFAIGGMPKVQEHVFFFEHDKTLIVTDLCFNLLHAKGLGEQLILSALGTYRRFGISRYFLGFVQDKKALSVSIQKMLGCDFDQIVMAHGEILGHDASTKQLLADALRLRMGPSI
jgi:hypothetical protein